MSIVRAATGMVAVCDYCKVSLDVEVEDKKEARTALKRKGWISNKDGEACDECADEFKE